MIKAPQNASMMVISVTNILNRDIPSENPNSNEPIEIKYGGVQIRMKAFETVPMPGDMAYHAAYKMAQFKIMLKNKLGEKFDKSVDRGYGSADELDNYMREALGDSVEAIKLPELDPQAKMEAELAKAKEAYDKDFQEAIPAVEETRTKQQIMKDIKKKGGKVDITMTKIQLLEYEKTL